MNAVQGSAVRIAAIAVNTLREALRNRLLAVFVLFALGLMAFSLVLGEMSLGEEVRVLKDLGLAGISLVGVAVSLFLGVNLLSKELDKKTVFFIIPKPMFRVEFLLGKFVGLVATVLLLTTLMSLVLWGFVLVQGGAHGPAMVRAEVLIGMELCVLIAVALLFSSFSSPYLSAMLTAGLWMIGRNTGELRTFASSAKLSGTWLGTILTWVANMVPDFQLFYVSGHEVGGRGIATVHEGFVDAGYVWQAGAYGALYVAGCLAVAAVLFQRRDLV